MSSHAQDPSANARPSRRRLGRDRREQILVEAMACFAERGFRGTTIRALASRVGLSEAALYRYFPSKEALYTAIIDHKMAAVDLVAVMRPVAQHGNELEFFAQLAREIFARVESDPAFLRLLYFSALEGHRFADPFFDSRVKRLREFLTDYISARVAEGRFVRTDPVIASRAFLGMVFDHLNVRLVLGQSEAYPQPVDEVAETFATIFVQGMQTRAGGREPS